MISNAARELTARGSRWAQSLRRRLKSAWSGSPHSWGIDETAFPSGFNVPYRRGSRQVRNLWHLPF
jgi:hypothetical protein